MMGEIAPRANAGFKAVLEQGNLGTGTPSGAPTGTIVSGAGALANATGDVVIGTCALVIQPGSSCLGNVVIGIGAKTTAGSSTGSIAIGKSAIAGDTGVSIGSGATNGLQSVAVGLGSSASGSRATALGFSAQATGAWSVSIGQGSQATNTYGITIGKDAGNSATQSIMIGRNAACSHNYAVNIGTGGGGSAATSFIGDNVFYNSHYKNSVSNFVMQTKTTDATLTALTIGGDNAEIPSNNAVFPNTSSWLVEGYVVARNATNTTTGSQTAVWEIKFVIYKDSTAGTTTIIGTPIINTIAQPSGTTTWSVTSITADTTNGCWLIKVTGEASKTIRWTAGLRGVKVLA